MRNKTVDARADVNMAAWRSMVYSARDPKVLVEVMAGGDTAGCVFVR